MTDGTSQGLFIVVAIVIFGIFVVLAYILFEDTLSPALANMFTTATEQSTKRLTNSLITTSDMRERADTPKEVVFGGVPSDFYSNDGKEIVLHNTTGSIHQGVYLDASYLEDNKEYEISFDYYSPDASITYLAGHFTRSTETKVYIDNVFAKNIWYHGMGVGANNWIAPDTNKHHVRVEFNTYTNVGGNRSFYIQPQRNFPGSTYKIVMSNFKLIEK